MRPAIVAAVLLAAILSAALAYWPGLYGDYVFDDTANILENERFKFEKFDWDVVSQIAASGDAGLFKRPVSMVSFAVNVAATGFDPYYMKLTNLAIHLVCGLLVFWFVRLLAEAKSFGLTSAQQSWVSLAVSSLWLVHPLNLTSVLYVVQRMTSLAALFTLAALVTYLLGRRKLATSPRSGWGLIVVALGVWTPLSLLSKETGVLIPVFLLIIELFAFKFDTGKPSASRALVRAYVVLFTAVGVAGGALLALRSNSLFGAYQLRDFDLWERLMTQCRVMFFYLELAVLPEVSRLGLYHDDFVISRSMFAPVSTLFAALGLCALVVAMVAVRRRWPLVSFAIAWFLGGHLLESTVLPLEMIHEHRNYLPLLGPLLVVCVALVQLSSSPKVVFVRNAVIVALFCALALGTWVRSIGWSSLVRHAEMEVNNHPGSERAHFQMGRIHTTLYSVHNDDRYFDAAVHHFGKSIELSSISPAGYVALIRLYFLADKTPPQAVYEGLIQKLSRGPQVPAAPTIIQNLNDCVLFEDCDVPDDVMLQIFSAYLNNRDIPSSVKQIVALVNAQYHVDVLGDPYGAIYILEKIVREEPNYTNGHRNLARMYRFVGRLDDAKRQVQKGRAVDKWGQMKPEFDREDEKINEALRQAK